MKSELDIIPSHKIDKTKWEQCIDNSNNSLIYAHTFYLDHLAENWHGIVLNDYDCVMPIPWKKKWRIRYCYHVPFIQQLGWFNQKEISSVEDFTQALLGFCRYGDYSFNYANYITYKKKSLQTNYTLPLSSSYKNIAENYSTDFLNNLARSKKGVLNFVDENIGAAIDLYKSLYQKRMPHVTANDFNNFLSLCSKLEKNNMAFAKKITNKKNETLATALLLKDEKRIYNLMNSTTQQGRRSGANHFLFDRIFNEFAKSPLLFDFEGSDIPGVKSFYKKCGAINQPFSAIHINTLPSPLRLIKR